MKKTILKTQCVIFILMALIPLSCMEKKSGPSQEIIGAMNLKRGAAISCGPSDKLFGSLDFQISCGEKVQEDFNQALAMLHSFEYDEAEKVFAKIIDEQPQCAMAYWGVAMSNFHALWAPPTDDELKKGTKAIEIAQSIPRKSDKETDYIHAISAFYKDWEKVDHRTRAINFEKAMVNSLR